MKLRSICAKHDKEKRFCLMSVANSTKTQGMQGKLVWHMNCSFKDEQSYELKMFLSRMITMPWLRSTTLLCATVSKLPA